MLQTPEIQTKIQTYRARNAGQGEPMTLEDWKECLTLLRSGRQAAMTPAKATKAKAGPVDTQSLKDRLKMLGKQT